MTLLDNYKLHATLISTLYHLVKIYFAAITHYTPVVQMQREHSSLVLLKQRDYIYTCLKCLKGINLKPDILLAALLSYKIKERHAICSLQFCR